MKKTKECVKYRCKGCEARSAGGAGIVRGVAGGPGCSQGAGHHPAGRGRGGATLQAVRRGRRAASCEANSGGATGHEGIGGGAGERGTSRGAVGAAPEPIRTTDAASSTSAHVMCTPTLPKALEVNRRVIIFHTCFFKFIHQPI